MLKLEPAKLAGVLTSRHMQVKGQSYSIVLSVDQVIQFLALY